MKQHNLPPLTGQLKIAEEQGFTHSFKVLHDGQLMSVQTNRVYSHNIYAVIEVPCHGARLYKITLHDGTKGTAVMWLL